MTAWTRSIACAMFVSLLVVGPDHAAAAGSYDGSRAFLCAVPTILECSAAGYCERHAGEDESAPTFIKVDVAGQTVTSGASRKSSLRSTAHVDGQLVLQGGENGRGWTLTIDEASGRMAGTVVENDYTFSLFGVCTLP
ncbi:MAG TPA: hypothetical protein VEL75_03685 [Candidatus Methylomirabilis sp.]|nr:hypothetical protein [Candidatus Methylomirabilis sp.]